MDIIKNVLVTMILVYLAVIVEIVATPVLLILDPKEMLNRWVRRDTAFHIAFSKQPYRFGPMMGNHVHDDTTLSADDAPRIADNSF